MANLEAIKADANRNAKTLVDYLRQAGLVGDGPEQSRGTRPRRSGANPEEDDE